MKLLTSQKNELFNIIKGHGFSPNLFSYDTVKDNRNSKQDVIKITYTPTPEFYFLIADDDYRGYRSYLLNYSPGISEVLHVSNIDRWDYMGHDFNLWLHALEREISQDDLWDSLRGIVNSIGLKADDDASKFTDTQLTILTHKMKQLQVGITTLELSRGQVDIINGKLDEILAQGKSLSKFDWQSLFLGTILSLMTSLAITSDVQHEFWLLVKQLFNGVLLLK